MRLLTKSYIVIFGITIIAYSPAGFTDDGVWTTLKHGGYVVLMRHAMAEKEGDPLRLKLNDCSVQRNLSKKGRQEATSIGQAFRNHNIPVIRVLHSRYCRTQ